MGTSYEIDFQGSFPGRGKIFFLSLDLPDRIWDPPSLLLNVYLRPFSRGLKRLKLEADHSPPSNAKVNNGGVIPPLSHTSSWRGAKFIERKENIAVYILPSIPCDKKCNAFFLAIFSHILFYTAISYQRSIF
jgi:hypothetical protein